MATVSGGRFEIISVILLAGRAISPSFSTLAPRVRLEDVSKLVACISSFVALATSLMFERTGSWALGLTKREAMLRDFARSCCSTWNFIL